MPIFRSVHPWTAGGRAWAAREVNTTAALAPCSRRGLLALGIGGASLGRPRWARRVTTQTSRTEEVVQRFSIGRQTGSSRRAREGRAADVEESRGRRVRIRHTRESRHHLLRPTSAVQRWAAEQPVRCNGWLGGRLVLARRRIHFCNTVPNSRHTGLNEELPRK
jgi:hypothetical protein